jgi:hypothetical protein
VLDGVQRRSLRFLEILQPLGRDVQVPSVGHTFHSGGRQDPDVLDQASQRGLVLGKPVTLGV